MMRLFHSVLCLLVLLTGGTISSAANFIRLGSNPLAANSGFPSIHTLKAFNGRLYFGYGDWNYHPTVFIGSYRPATGRFHVEHLAFTDSIGVFREINGKLYVPHMDPSHYEDFKDFSVLEDGVWRDASPLGMLHVFDMATLTGTDLWCVGSRTDYGTNGGGAAVYRSEDGGRTWEDKTLPTSESRYYFSYVKSGELWVTDYVYDTNGVGRRVWPISPMAKARVIRSGTNELNLGVRMGPNDAPGMAMTSPTSILGTGQTGFDYAWDGSVIYVLKEDGVYARAFPFQAGEAFSRLPFEGLPTNGRAIEVMDGVIYVADGSGGYWGARVDGGELVRPTVPGSVNLPDEFGRSISIDGDSMAVGSPGYTIRGAFCTGRVTVWDYVLGEDGTSKWTQTAVIDPPFPSPANWFGKSLALSGDLLAVLDVGADGSATDRGSSARLYLYQRSNGGWVLRESIGQSFAHSVVIEGTNLVVAFAIRNVSLPIYFPPSPNVTYYSIERSNDVASLRWAGWHGAWHSDVYEPFQQVAIDGNFVAAGASGDSSRWGGSGVVRILERGTNGRFMQTNMLSHRDYLESGTNVLKPDQFGFSLAMKDGWLAAGAPRDDQMAPDCGAVYVYRRTVVTNGELSYLETQKILPPVPINCGQFGASLAMTTNRLIVGAPGFEGAGRTAEGRAYVYELAGTNWVFIGTMRRPPNATVEFGIEVAANERWMAAGARFSSASSNLTDRVTVLPHVSAYDLWTGFHELTELAADPSSDDDADGADNLAEYAYNLDPSVADAFPIEPDGGSSGLPRIRWVEVSASNAVPALELIHVRRRNPEVMGIQYLFERSDDLKSWAPAGADAEVSQEIGADWNRVFSRFSVDPNVSSGFLRVRVVRLAQ